MNPFTLRFIRQRLEGISPGDSLIPAAANFLIGEFLNVNLQRFDNALEFFRQALQSLPVSAQYAPELRMRIQDRIAHLALKKYNLVEAFPAAQECEALADSLDLPFTSGHCLKCLGDIHRDFFHRQNEQAGYYQDALENFQRSFANTLESRDTLATLLNLFFITTIKLDQDSGFQNIQRYLSTAADLVTDSEKYNDFRAQITYLQARFLAKNREFAAALEHFSQAFRQFTVTEDTARLMETAYLTAEILFRQGNIPETITHLDQALAFSPKVASDSQLESIHFLLYQAHKSQGNPEEALRAHEAFFKARELVSREDQLRYIRGLETQFQLEAKQKEIQQKQIELEQESENNRKLTAANVLLALFITLLTFSFIRARNTRNQLRTRNAIIIQQKQQLEELDDLKSRFFANISHELKTPLALIKAPLEYMKQKHPVKKAGAFFLDTALNNTMRLEQLVNELLDINKIESGKTTLKLGPYEMKAICRQVIESFIPFARSRQVELVWQEGTAVQPVIVHTDQDALLKIITNLVSNAVKFSPAGSKVVLALETRAQEAILSVMDNGPGIYPDDLPFIFNRFHQSKHEDVQHDNSTGIGLSLSEELAKLMNGKLGVESEREKGSTFFLHLPLAAMPDEPGEDTRKAGPPPAAVLNSPVFREMEKLKGQDFHILVVEDHEELRDYLSRLLGDYFQVHTAPNGPEALKLLEKEDSPLTRPGKSLIISDLMMPGMDGVQLTEQLKLDKRFQNIPIIMLTARRDRNQRLKALTIGVDDYLTKPFDNQELLIRIKNLVIRSQEKLRPDPAVGDSRHDENKPEGIGQNNLTQDAEQLDWLKDLETFAIKHLSDSQFNVGFLSTYANMSDRNFQRHMKRVTGMTPSEYIKEIRLHQARELLESGTIKSVKGVSRAVGFSSHEYFSDQFFNRFGRRPSTYF